MEENRRHRSLRQREKGEPIEELRHLVKPLKIFHSFVYSFLHSHVCSHVRRSQWAPSVWCTQYRAGRNHVPPLPPGQSSRRGEGGAPLPGTSWVTSCPVGGGTTLEFTVGTGRQREQCARFKQNEHSLPLSTESDHCSEPVGCAAEGATVAGGPQPGAPGPLGSSVCLIAFPVVLLSFAAPCSSLLGVVGESDFRKPFPLF